MNSYYHGVWRMDWGLGNPNRTATLIACLMMALWAIPVFWKRGFWPTLIVLTALAWCLVQTYSRGGMVAFLAGTGILLFWLPRPWPRERWIGVVAALWILGGFVLYAKAQTRYGQGLFTDDQSINSRLVVWSHVPEMMAAAPWGWGAGKSGDTYTQWFEPVQQSTIFLNLISSHFTFMVEWGWLASCCYLFFWFAILTLCWPAKAIRLGAVPLAIWVAFGVGACFSHVEGNVWLWIVPLLFLGYVLIERWRSQSWPDSRPFLASALASGGIVAVLVLTGFATASLPMRSNNGTVTIGRGSTKTLIVVDRQIMGPFFGRTFRKYLAKNPGELSDSTFVLTESANVPLTMTLNRVVISGKCAASTTDLPRPGKGGQIILVNPVCFPDEASIDKGAIDNACVYFGEYSQAGSRSFWSGHPGIRAFQINGAGDFVPTWPEAILAPHKT